MPAKWGGEKSDGTNWINPNKNVTCEEAKKKPMDWYNYLFFPMNILEYS